MINTGDGLSADNQQINYKELYSAGDAIKIIESADNERQKNIDVQVDNETIKVDTEGGNVVSRQNYYSGEGVVKI